MNQEINFMYAERPRSDGLFNGRLVLNIIFGAWIIMGASFTYLTMDMSRLQHERTVEKEIMDQQRQRTLETEQRFPPTRVNPQKAEKLEAMRLERDQKLKLIELMSTQSTPSNRNTGFYKLLAGIADQHKDGLWFKEIVITGQPKGMALDLKGGTTDPGMVPTFLKGLSGNSVFSGMHFTVLGMMRNDKDARTLDFTLTSSGQAPVNPVETAKEALPPTGDLIP